MKVQWQVTVCQSDFSVVRAINVIGCTSRRSTQLPKIIEFFDATAVDIAYIARHRQLTLSA
jgi:hypothetical protein